MQSIRITVDKIKFKKRPLISKVLLKKLKVQNSFHTFTRKLWIFADLKMSKIFHD